MPSDPPNKRENCRATFRRIVRFEFTSLIANQVRLVGSFNGWRPEAGRMCPLGSGKWAVAVSLLPGRYEYLFVVDGDWIPDPAADHSILNELGERNSLLTVAPVK